MHRKTVTGILILLLVTPIASVEVMSTESTTPLERVASTPKGQLKGPYPDYAAVAFYFKGS